MSGFYIFKGIHFVSPCQPLAIRQEDTVAFSSLSIEPATIDEIVVFTSKKGDDYE